MDFDFDAILQVFAAEAEENLGTMEDALLALEGRPGDAELLHTVFRVAHTLKGDASNLGFPAVARFAHGVEDLLDRLREDPSALVPPVPGLLLAAVDALRALVPAAIAGAEGLDPGHAALLDRIEAAAAALYGPSPESGGSGAGTADRVPSPPAWVSIAREEIAVGASAGLSSPSESSIEPRSPDISPAADSAPASGDDAGRRRARTLRVDVDKLDRTLDLVGELTIARGRVAQMLEEGRPAADVLEAHREAGRLHMDLQELVMKLRMVPLGPTFRSYLRTVRDVAPAHGKRARLEIEGEDVEVDTSVVEHLRDALTHLVRNAVDHGIETPDVRAARGKDPCGTIRLSARHEGGTVVIEVTDDGAGLDRARIAARAQERGAAAGERPADADLLRLVVAPGFSTADQVTELSGRGVGLDVVRRQAEALRGTLSLHTAEGRGSRFTLRLPLTLAVIEGFSVGVGDETYVIPLHAVVECLELPRERHDAGAEGVLSLRGEPLPFLRLRGVLGVAGEPPRRQSVVVVRHDGGRAGLVVDQLLGDGQAVIKPLGRLFGDLPGVSGSTILGSGRIALILDVASLVRRALEAHAHPAAA